MSSDTTEGQGDLTGIHHTELWTYIGRRISATGNRLVYGYLDHQGNEAFFSKKVMIPRWAVVGSIFEVKFGGPTTYFNAGKNGPDFIGYHAKKNERTEWELEDRTADASIGLLNRAKKDQQLLLERRLAPIRRQYKKLWMSPTGQSALLAAVIREITH